MGDVMIITAAGFERVSETYRAFHANGVIEITVEEYHVIYKAIAVSGSYTVPRPAFDDRAFADLMRDLFGE